MKQFYLAKSFLLAFFVLINLSVFAQTGSISGKVLDETNQPLPGASVSVKGTDRQTSTDANGNFKLTGISSGNVSVVVKYIGYQEMEKSVNATGDVTVSFQLVPASTSLSEVVVVGYGTQRKKDVTGSIATVTTKDFVKGQITNPEQLIMGKVAGVQITSNGGAPGSGSTIRVRGGASLNASNDPLIVVDGVPLDNNGISGSANALGLINPNDIESFNILKDASATAIYGSRGSNGVIIITTKKGQSGKPRLSFNSNLSLAKNANTVDILSPEQFKTLVNNANTPLATPALKSLVGSASTDWQNEIYQSAITTDNNLSVSGSVKALPYRISLGYLDQNGVLRTDNRKRTSLAINLNPRLLKDALKINLALKGSLSQSQFANQGAIGAAASFDPSQPVLSGNSRYGGYWQWLEASNTTTGLRGLSPKNPVGILEQRDDNSNVQRSIGNIQLDYTFPFLKELKANLNLGYDVSRGSGNIMVTDSAATDYRRFKDENNILRGGVNNEYLQNKTNTVSDFYLNYITDLKSINSRVDLMAGTSYQAFSAVDNFYANYSFDGVKQPGTDPAFPLDKPANRLLSYYGRMVYSLNNKYILTGTVRTDGSSRLSEDNRWGVFPSGALAWNVSEESFLKNSKVISNLKLRVGYGVTGQQEGISNYSYLGNYSISNATAQYQLGNTFYNLYRPLAYNPNLKWEETATTNAGMDFGFANNRVTGSIDVYLKKTKDLLNDIPQPAGTNFTNRFISNVGNMENKGIEFLLSTDVIKNQNVTWNVGFNSTYNKNTITNLTAAPDPNYVGVPVGGISGGTGNTVQIHSTGFNRSAFYVFQQVYNNDGKPIENAFVDRNLDGQISTQDLYHFKGPDAQVFLGFNSSLTYKRWNAGFVMRANLGNYVYNNVASSTGTLRNIFNPLNFLNNGSTDVLETNFSGAGDRYLRSDYYVQNASFLKMDNLNIGYNVGKIFNNTTGLRINANAQNVFVITKYKGIDPEINGGIDNNFYPRPRTFVLGLNLDF